MKYEIHINVTWEVEAKQPAAAAQPKGDAS